MSSLNLSRALMFLSFIGVLAVSPLLADDAQLSMQLSNDGSVLVVRDSVRSAVAVYRISSNDLTLIGRRDLEKDMARDSSKTAASAAPLLTKDVPGQDPPDFSRPENSVRINASYSLQNDSETWSAAYRLSGTVEEVFENLRTDSKGWRVLNERVSPETAEINLTRDLVDLYISARRGVAVTLEVRETRRKP